MKTRITILLIFLFSAAFGQKKFILSADSIDFGKIGIDTVKLKSRNHHEETNNHGSKKVKIWVKNISDTAIFFTRYAWACEQCPTGYYKDTILPGDSGYISLECRVDYPRNFNRPFLIYTSAGEARVNIKATFEYMPHLLELNLYDLELGTHRSAFKLYDGIDVDNAIAVELENVSDNDTLHIGNFEAELPFVITQNPFDLYPHQKMKLNIQIHPKVPEGEQSYMCFPRIYFTSSGRYNENICISGTLNINRK